MPTNQAFKTYRKPKRVHSSEEKFGLGMFFSEAPLTEGFSRVLVNYDMRDQGQKLIPRPGLRDTSVLNSTLPYSQEMMLAAGRPCAEIDGKIYAQLILGQPSLTKLANTNLYMGKAFVGTGRTDLTWESLTPLDRFTTFTKPEQAGIHDLLVSPSVHIARHVGTFAYNDDYYCFVHNSVRGQLIRTKFKDNKYTSEVIKPKELTPKEASMWGYNMLTKNPYFFTDTHFIGGLQLLGLLPYDGNNNLIMSPRTNQDIILRCYYAGPNQTYDIVWEWKEPAANVWTQMKRETVTLGGLPQLTANFSSPAKALMIRVTATRLGTTFPEQVIIVGFSFDKETYGASANVIAKNYDLTKASGLVYWRNRIGFFGLAEDSTVLFLSDTNDPSYVPYPANVELFDEPIIHAMPILDDLLVFTTTKLQVLTLAADGWSWTKKTIQDGLNIKPWDIHLIQTIRNMIFFKSGNFYYMVVPRTDSRTGELVIAPVFRNIELFFNEFKSNVDSICATLYDYTEQLTLIHYYNYLDFEDIHNVYVFETISGVYINIVLLYNSVSRSWRIYTHETPHIYLPYSEDATKKGTLISLLSLNLNTAVQFLEYDSTNVTDKYITQNSQPIFFKNYQLLDTGYRDHAINFKKRYREFQIQLNNISQQSLSFYTEFIIDGETREDFYKYVISHNTNPTSPHFGLISVVKQIIDLEGLANTPGTTILGASLYDSKRWELDVSVFPEITFWKIRIPVSGKGYSPRIILASLNQERYELLNMSWVFRPLYAR